MTTPKLTRYGARYWKHSPGHCCQLLGMIVSPQFLCAKAATVRLATVQFKTVV